MLIADRDGALGAWQRTAQPHRLRHLMRRHPEWWCVALSATAWLMIGGALDAAGGAMQHADGHAGEVDVSISFALGELQRWMVMVAAMMFPLVLGAARTTAQRSLWARRHRAIVAFLSGYSAAWMTAGVLAIAVVEVGRRLIEHAGLAQSVVFVLAALWQLTPAKRRALRECHRTIPLAPRGWRADRDCARYGLEIGSACIASCGMLMVGCLAAAHNPAVMVGATVVGFAERSTVRPDQRVIGGAILLFAALARASV